MKSFFILYIILVIYDIIGGIKLELKFNNDLVMCIFGPSVVIGIIMSIFIFIYREGDIMFFFYITFIGLLIIACIISLPLLTDE